ncbi:lytic transglycosylase domain-containing protein [Rubellimicrobium arenae]|uniref:lytic transglycosylase domain-containing protein n=1 Tax=Rubellimicrobium arenae TaxID=2817372 RepID=UPI001B302982|nr:lytic transglycosylase domain-containing protein [Rubellimicrobium arenae]
MIRRLLLSVLLLAVAAPGPGGVVLAAPPVAEAVPAVAAAPLLRPRARPLEGGGRRCSGDGRACIALASYAADVCRTIEVAAGAVQLDPGFVARLLWRESLFDSAAVSPAGAQGIAQFMPATAALRGLADPFNPAEAILASAAYLGDLRERFGNLGLAAAAYNAGEERVARYLSGGGLPGETRAYVVAITGHGVDEWRDGPTPEPDLALSPGVPFAQACRARAEARALPGFEPRLRPWAVVLAGRDSRDAAELEARRVVRAHAALLDGERIDVSRARYPGMRSARHFAQVGRDSRAAAETLCRDLRATGVGCLVRRN